MSHLLLCSSSMWKGCLVMAGPLFVIQQHPEKLPRVSHAGLKIFICSMFRKLPSVLYPLLVPENTRNYPPQSHHMNAKLNNHKPPPDWRDLTVINLLLLGGSSLLSPPLLFPPSEHLPSAFHGCSIICSVAGCTHKFFFSPDAFQRQTPNWLLGVCKCASSHPPLLNYSSLLLHNVRDTESPRLSLLPLSWQCLPAWGYLHII